jgi:hypothetical protein
MNALKLKSFFDIIDPLSQYYLRYHIRHFNGKFLGYYSSPDDNFFKFIKYGYYQINIKTFIKMNDYLFFPGDGSITAVPMVILKLQRAWRKWFLRRIKERNDHLKRELVEYIYHPKRIDFENKMLD